MSKSPVVPATVTSRPLTVHSSRRVRSGTLMVMVILGGVSVWGGKGSILGVVLAALVFGLVTFGLGLMNIPGIVMSIFTGTLLILVVAVPALVKR